MSSPITYLLTIRNAWIEPREHGSDSLLKEFFHGCVIEKGLSIGDNSYGYIWEEEFLLKAEDGETEKVFEAFKKNFLKECPRKCSYTPPPSRPFLVTLRKIVVYQLTIESAWIEASPSFTVESLIQKTFGKFTLKSGKTEVDYYDGYCLITKVNILIHANWSNVAENLETFKALFLSVRPENFPYIASPKLPFSITLAEK